MFLGILTMITALCISAVAIYYSVAGLMAIFAAAAIPIMIMGGTLEVAKLVTVVWLHYYWREAAWWLKTYLTTSVLVLMFITSMGIFGFLSSAHIEQTATATEGLAQIQRLDTEIARQQAVIDRTNVRIETIQTQDSGRDQEIQAQINKEQQRIDSAYTRIQPSIDEQNKIITNEEENTQQRIALVQNEINRIDEELKSLSTALSNNNIELAQGIVGVRQDGDLGPNTEAALDQFRTDRQSSKQELIDRAESIRQEANPTVKAARQEIQRLRSLAEQQIEDSNVLINRLRSQLGQIDRDEIEKRVEEQRQKITTANNTIDTLTEEKYTLEADYRKLEAEVGPVKYLAEFVYGADADKDLLEEAVRWVIIVIIFVFDPLAVLLLVASQYTFELNAKQKKTKTKIQSQREIAEEIKKDFFEKEIQCTEHYSDVTAENDPTLDVDDIVEMYIPSTTEEEQRRIDYEEKEKDETFAKSKTEWKTANPNETLKIWKKLYIQGKIDKLPWEE